MKNVIALVFLIIFCPSCNNKRVHQQDMNIKQNGDKLAEAYKNGNWDLIISICDTLISEDDPQNLTIMYSEALTAKGRYKEAIDVLDKKIARDPSNYYLLQSKGNTYCMAEQYDSAIYYYNRVIEMRPTYARPYLYKAGIYEITGNNQDAIVNYMQAVHLFAEHGFKKEVYMYCNKILDLDSTNLEAKYYLMSLQESNY